MFWNTVDDRLREYLNLFMGSHEFDDFRLVGGTALSLQIGHRMSVDIDLFTDAQYGTISFDNIESFLSRHFGYVDGIENALPVGMGRSYFIGSTREVAIKLDVYYSENFITPPVISENVRLASVEEIIAMKIDVVSRGGRKKDFWDIHELFNTYTVNEMLDLHVQRYPFRHDRNEILAKFTNFENADDDFEPYCLRGKHWDMVKMDIVRAIERTL